MIGIRDALTLAHTKIRSKRLRLLITTIVSGLVFGVMAGATVLVDGMGSSLTSFARHNLDGRFLVSGQPNMNRNMMTTPPNDPGLIAEVQKIHAAYIAERKAAAKKYGVEYDERSEVPPIAEDNNPGVPAEWRRTVNFGSVAWQRYQKANAKPSDTGIDAFKTLVTPLGASRVIETKNLGHLTLTLLPDGKEDLTRIPTVQETEDGMQSSLTNGQYTIVDDDLVKPFILEPNEARKNATGVPVLIMAEDAIAVFGKSMGLAKRPKETAAQIRWFQELRDRVNDATFATCYRNQGELKRVEQARTQAQEIQANKGNKDYRQPDLVLALPTTPCGPVTVARDVRTAAQKKLEDNMRDFEQEFNPTPAPLAELVTFQVVGLLPSPSPSPSGIDAVLSGLVGTNYGFSAVVPGTSLANVPVEHRHEALFATAPPVSSDPWVGPMGQDLLIASFPTVDKARKAVADNSCMMNWTPRCESMPFHLQTYGTNYLAVDDIVRQLRPVIIVILSIAFGIATIIIWAMMGRVIADSRRETAVFRAIGAKRSDIMAVYVTYSLWVAVRIVIFAALLGAAIAGAVHLLYAGRATDVARLAYGVFSPDPTFSFLGFRSPVLWWILGGIVVMSLIAITPPLLRNIRRNPIKDMRDE